LSKTPASDQPVVESSLLTYFVLTYAVTWALWAPVVSGLTSHVVFLRTALWFLGVFTPALVALALCGLNRGSTEVKTLLGRIFRWQVNVRWYLFALTYMAAIKLAVAFLHRITTGAWPQFGHESPIVIALGILISTPVQAGEELGWRGYALPRLARRMGFARASVLLGVIWAGWHLPQFFSREADTYGQSFLIWSLEVTAFSVAIAWLYIHTNGSLLLVMLMHSAINNTKDIVPSGLVGASHPFSLHATVITYMTATLLWIAAAYFLARISRAKQTSVEKRIEGTTAY